MPFRAAVLGGLAVLAGQASSSPVMVYEQAIPVDKSGLQPNARLSDDVLLTHLSADTLSAEKNEQMVSEEQKAEERDRAETIQRLHAKLEASEALLRAMDKQLATITAARDSRLKKTNEYRRVLSGFDGEDASSALKDQIQAKQQPMEQATEQASSERRS